jgi:hypothetical protein
MTLTVLRKVQTFSVMRRCQVPKEVSAPIILKKVEASFTKTLIFLVLGNIVQHRR